jgi:transposase
LAFWVGYGAAEIAHVVQRLKEIVLSSTRIFADETTMRVLDPDRGKTKQSYFWVAARDDRACGGADPPAVIYQYATRRAKRHADALLGGYRGIVQCDGYNAYKQLAGPARDDPPVKLAFCWSHMRRGFYNPAESGTSPIATEALVRIAALYRIGAEIPGKAPAERLAKRQELSRPLVTGLRVWFEAQLKTLPARGPMAEVIRYPLNHWAGLE